jgi:trimeric autotransporter adhesin
MRTPVFFVWTGLLLSAPLLAQQPPGRPAAPQVTVGANLKELTFDWEPVEGAVVYRLLEKLTDRSYYTAVGNRIPAWRPRATHPIAVHLHNWNETRYAVQACNAAGCTRSAEIFPVDLKLDTIGYVKASNTGAQDRFGNVLAISSDGSTMAVAAEREASSASGVNGNQADNSSASSGAVYVYRRTGRAWAQEAYLKAGANQPQQQFGAALAISADGSILAVGTPGQDTTLENSGAVFVYTRAADNSWHLMTTLSGPNPQANDQFGYSVDLSLDGRTLKVSSRLPLDGGGNPEGRTHLYVRPDLQWQHSVTLLPHYAGDICPSTRMSTDGRTLVASCFSNPFGTMRLVTRKLANGTWVHASDMPLPYFMVEHPLALNHRGDRMAITLAGVDLSNCNSRWVQVNRWDGGGWVQEGLLGRPFSFTCPTLTELAGFAKALAFEKYGELIAVGDSMGVAGSGWGNPLGMVTLWERTYSSTSVWWQSRSILDAPNPQLDDRFGSSVGLSGNGRILAVGAVGEDSAARGIDGNQNSESSANSGAVYLY